jgi:hypothetical protein
MMMKVYNKVKIVRAPFSANIVIESEKFVCGFSSFYSYSISGGLIA